MHYSERKGLEEDKNVKICRAEEILESAKKEERELTEAEAAELAEIKDDVRDIKEKLDKLDLASDVKKMIESEDYKNEEDKNMTEDKTRLCDEEEKRAFEAYIRSACGFPMNERSGELTPASGSAGVLIPETIVNYIIRKVYDICPILEKSQKFNTKGKLVIPYYPADANNITVAYQSEFVELTSTSGKFASVELGGFLAGCLTKVSRSLINNTDIDIVGFVVDEMAYAIKRFIEKELLNPSDPTHKVTGLSTLTNGITAAAADAITANEVVKLHDKIKDEFQQNAVWIMHSSTRTALRLLTDNVGRYLLQDDISLPFGTSILGKPVFVSDNMPEIATGADVIYYGDLRGLATKFSEEINIEVLRERYAAEHAYGIVGWFEFDAKVIDEQQIAKLTMA